MRSKYIKIFKNLSCIYTYTFNKIFTCIIFYDSYNSLKRWHGFILKLNYTMLWSVIVYNLKYLINNKKQTNIGPVNQI